MRIVTSYDVRSGAVASKDHPGDVYVDPRIPERFWKYLALHEEVEQLEMILGRSYLDAHTNFATPAEKAAVEADGLSWDEYTREIDGYLANIEHEPAPNPPPDPHVNIEDAIGHHRHNISAASDKVSKKSVNYREGSTKEHCGNCSMYRDHICTLVRGHIEPDCVCNKWEARKVSAETTKLAAISMQARSLNIPTGKHPNRMPFSGILTRIDEPSDAAPDGSNGARVMITMEAARKALDSLLGMAVDYQPNWDGHDPQAKIGVITGAEINGNAITVNGIIYEADFPEVAKQIKANKHALGMSFEARDLMTTDPQADPIPIFDCVFTGAAILLRDKAAYKTTAISAQRGDKEGFLDMTADELKQQLDAALKPITEAVAAQAAAVAEQAKKIAELEQAPAKIMAANHLAKIEPHAKRLEDAADKMDNDGIGGHDTRGHAAVLRHMAGSMRADAAEGKMPHIYHQDSGIYASAEVRAASAAEATQKVRAEVEAEYAKKLDEVKAAAEKAEKELKDQLASTETKLADMKAAAEKAAAETDKPERKTLSPAGMHLLAKAGIEAPQDGSKLDISKLNEVLANSKLSTSQRFELKTALAHAKLID